MAEKKAGSRANNAPGVFENVAAASSGLRRHALSYVLEAWELSALLQ